MSNYYGQEYWQSQRVSHLFPILPCSFANLSRFGYVEFATAAAAKAALEAKNGVELDGRAMNIDFSTPRSNDNAGFKERTNDRAKRFGDQKSTPSDTIFVGNI